MAFECPYCRKAVDPRAEICPHCASDIRYQRPRSPVAMLQGVQGTAKGLGWELCFKLALIASFALLMGIPFLPLIIIGGGIYLFDKLVLASISSTIDTAKSQSDTEKKSGKGPQGKSHE